MDKALYKFMSIYQGLQTNLAEPIPYPEYVPNDSELDNILREIFSVDEVTGLPKGDLAYYLSPDGNPTVKQWLENNLLRPRASRGENPADLTDDLIVEFSRGADESVSDYSTRLLGIYDSAKAEYEKSLQTVQSVEPNVE